MMTTSNQGGRKVVRLVVMVIAVAAICVGDSMEMAEAAQPVEITYLSAGTAALEQAQNEKWVAEFNATHPDIHVNYEVVSWADLFTKVMAYMAAGDPPDVAWYGSSQIRDWYNMGILEPLDEWLGPSKDEYLSFILEEGSDVLYDGKLYGAPFTLVALALVGRRDFLQDAGIDPETIRTWDDFVRACERLTEPPNRYGTLFSLGEARLSAHHAEAYWPANGLVSIVDFREEKRDEYLEVLRVLQELSSCMPPAQVSWVHKDNIAAYANGTIALFPTGSYFQGDLAPVAPAVIDEESSVVLPMPHSPGEEPVTATYTVGYVMFQASDKKEAAAEFIRFMTQKRVLAEWPMNLAPKSGITVDDRVRALGEEARWWQEAWLNLLETTNVVGLIPYSPSEEIYKIFNNEMLRLLAGQTTPEEAYDSLRAQITPILVD